MKLSKKLLSLLLCAVMVPGAVPFSGIISFAEESCTHIDDNSDNICDTCKDKLYFYSELNDDTVHSTVKEIPSEAVNEASSIDAVNSAKDTAIADINAQLEKEAGSDTPDTPDTPEELENVPPRFTIDKRNRLMLDWSDVVVTYVCTSIGGTAKFKDLAEKKEKRVINLSCNYK